MQVHLRLRSLPIKALAAAIFFWSGAAAFAADAIQAGGSVKANGMTGTVKKLEALPLVSSTYTERMIWQKYDDPRLRTMRDSLRLDEMIRGGKDEFERQLLLLAYVNKLWEYGDPRPYASEFSPAKILELQQHEQRFYCEHYSCVMCGTAASLGWEFRLLTHGEHTWGEMWSNQYGKWVYMDPTGNKFYTDLQGKPLSEAEARDDFYKTGGKNFQIRRAPSRTVSSGGEKYDVRKSVVGYHPNTDLLDERFDYKKMFMIKDQFSKKAKIRGEGEPVADPLKDPYFPINQAALTLQAAPAGLAVTVRTLTPNFKTFRARVDGGKWRNVDANFAWNLHGGDNLLEVISVNLFEVDGPASRVEVAMDGKAAATNDQIGALAPEEEAKVAGMAPLKVWPPSPADLKPVAFEEKLTDEWINMWYGKGHWVEWTANIPAAGKYNATLYYSSSYYPQREVRVNGQAVPGLESVILGYTGGWRNWKKAALPVALDLQAGRNALRLTGLDDTSVWLKRIRLTPVAGGKDIDLEAIAFTAEGGGTVQRTLIPKTGFLMCDAKGHWMEWDITAPVAGDYKLSMVMGAQVEAVREVKVNGEKISHPDGFKVAPTGGYRVFTEMPFGTAHLNAGKNVVRTENLTPFGPNLASMKFVKDTGEEVLVKAVDFVREGGGKATKP